MFKTFASRTSQIGRTRRIFAGLLISIVAMHMSTGAAQSQTKNPNPNFDAHHLEMFQAWGVTFEYAPPPGACSLKCILHQEKYLQALPAMQRLGIINPNLTARQVNDMPVTLGFTIGLALAPTVTIATLNIYPAAETCHFETYVSFKNASGSDEINQLFTYELDRGTYNRTDFTSLSSEQFLTTVQNYRLSGWAKTTITKERKLVTP